MIWGDGEMSEEQSGKQTQALWKPGANFGVYSGGEPRTQVEKALGNLFFFFFFWTHRAACGILVP